MRARWELNQSKAAAVFVDIDAAPFDMLEDLQPMIDQYLATRFIVMASERRDEWVLRAMQAGARDFLEKSTIPTNLSVVLERVAPPSGSNGEAAHGVTTILSAGGGCGATTIAVNLADELQRASGGSTLLMDLDCCFGGVASHLGVSAEYGIADVLADGDRIDAHLLRSTAVTHEERLHVLAGPTATMPGFRADLKLEHLPQALRAAKRAFDHTIVEAPRITADVAGNLAKFSAVTLLVMELNVDDIRIARSQLERLAHRGIAPGRVLPVVNRFRRSKSLVTLAEAEKALGVDRLLHLSNDYRNVVSSINYGQTLARVAPRSPFRRDLRRLAQAIHAARGAELVPGKLR